MDQNDKNILVTAVDLIKRGKNADAVKILADLLARHPQIEQGWYLMGMALDTPEKKRFAFERALKINPNSQRAKQQLLKLEEDALPKAPTPIKVEPPPPPSKVADAPIVSPPWIEPEDTASEAEVELPAWAMKIEMAKEKAQQAEEEKILEPPWMQQDRDDYSLPPFSPEDTPDRPAFLAESQDEPETEEQPEKKRKRWFRKEKSSEEMELAQEIDEEKPARKRWTKKDKKDEKRSEKTSEEAEKKTLQEELLGDEPKTRFRIKWRPSKGLVRFFVLLIIIGALAGGGYYFRDSLIPLVSQYAPTVIGLFTQEPTATPDYTATMTFTPAFQPTLPATWTPAVTQSGKQVFPTLPADDFTPSITPTPLPMQASLIEEMEEIEQQFASVRGLRAPANVDKEMLPTSKFQNYMAALALSKLDRAAIEKERIVLEALGFVTDEYYQVEVLMNDLADFVGGYFHPDQYKIYLPGSGLYGLEKYIYSYEYGYALLDENFEIFSKYCQGALDTCLAETALVVGDISLSQEFWLKDYPIEFDPEEYFNLDNPTPLFKEYWAPPYFDAYRNFAVVYGYPFVSHLYQSDGWQTIGYTYRYPPTSSEQVMHPEKYDVRENRVLLYDSDLTADLGEGWVLIERETLGEWRSYLLLTAADYPDAVRPEREAARAAAGWGGDTYQVYANSEAGSFILSAHWTWDTAADREEYYESLAASQAGRFENAVFGGPGESTCWMLDGIYSCIFQNSKDILWICANDLNALEITKATFGQFP